MELEGLFVTERFQRNIDSVQVLSRHSVLRDQEDRENG
jgi:hypothetical protein